MTQIPVYYDIRKRYSSGGEYTHIEIRVWGEDSNNSGAYDRSVELTWQGDRRSLTDDKARWYGFRIRIEVTNAQVDAVRKGATLLNRVIPKVGSRYYKRHTDDIFRIVKRLQRIGKRVVYDNRVSSWVEIDKLLPPEYHAYRDNYDLFPERRGVGCLVGCEAASPEEAQKILIQKAQVIIATGGWGKDYAQKWLDAGAPVKDITIGKGYEAPSVPDIDYLLRQF